MAFLNLMNNQLIFFLLLAFLFLIKGLLSMNVVMQLAGILIIVFLIFNVLTEKKVDKKKMYKTGFNFVAFLGHVDLTLGILLLIKGIYGFIPNSVLVFLAIVLFIKAVPSIFSSDVASMIDVTISLFIVSSALFEFPGFILVVVSVYLIQKGLFSYFS